jgi:hypothetical protein
MRGWVALSTPEDFGGKALSEIIWTEMFFRTLRYLDDCHGAARPVGARPPGGRWRVKCGQKVRRFT